VFVVPILLSLRQENADLASLAHGGATTGGCTEDFDNKTCVRLCTS
jgi:hypothetical protein